MWDTLLRGGRQMRLPTRHFPPRDLGPGFDTFVALLVILLVIAFNVVMMWRIATATV